MPGGTDAARDTSRPGARGWRQSVLGSPNAAVLCFSAVLAALAIAGYQLIVRDLAPIPAPFRIPWYVLAVGFALADLLAIHIEIGDDAHSFTLSEVPLVIGMFLSTPGDVVLARVVGAFIVLAIVQRQQALKLGFNLSLAALESVCAMTALAAARSVLGDGVAASWTAVMIAVWCATAMQSIAIPLVIKLSGGPRERGLARRMALYGFVSTAATASLGIAAVTLLDGRSRRRPRAHRRDRRSALRRVPRVRGA